MTTLSPKIEQAMILAAGFGKRLLPLTLELPKPLIPLSGTTCLDETIRKLRAVGVKKIVVNTHHLAHQIHHHLDSHADVITSHEAEILETGGGVAKALECFGEQPFFCINGDVWWEERDFPSLEKLRQRWDRAKMDVLLMVIPKAAALGYQGTDKLGDYNLDDDHRLGSPPFGKSAAYIYSGVQILSAAVFQKSAVFQKLPVLTHQQTSHLQAFSLNKTSVFSLKKIYDEAEQRQRLFGIVHQDYWADIGSFEGLKQTRQILLNKKS